MNSVTLNRFRENLKLSRYMRIHTYSKEDSDLILSHIQHPGVYFDDSGSLAVADETGSVLHLQNQLTKQNVELTSSNIVTGDGKYTYSAGFGLWFLYTDATGIVSLYYNPIPRPEYIDWFRRDPINAMNLVIDACIENGGRDPVCGCVNKQTDTTPDTEFCMNQLFGGDVELRKSVKKSSKNKVGYNQLAEVCGCANVECKKEHPLMLVYRRAGGGHECPGDITISICNTTFSAGGNTNFSGDIQQQCGSELNPSVDPVPTPPPTPTPPPSPVDPPVPTPPPPTPTPASNPDKIGDWFLLKSKAFQGTVIASLIIFFILMAIGIGMAKTWLFAIGGLGLVITCVVTIVLFSRRNS